MTKEMMLRLSSLMKFPTTCKTPIKIDEVSNDLLNAYQVFGAFVED